MQQLDGPSAARARDVFEKNCAGCHGASGGGLYYAPKARPPAIAGKSVATVEHQVRQGGVAMPAFSPAVLPDPTLQDLAAYVHEELGHPPPEPPAIGLRELDPFLVGLFVWGALLAVTCGLAILFGRSG